MARPDAGGGKYPPSEFSQKYSSVLCPKGKLLTPKVRKKRADEETGCKQSCAYAAAFQI